MVICKACGTENRDEAKFCSSCGVPLPQKKEQSKKGQAAHVSTFRSFWMPIFTVAAIIGIGGYFIFHQIDSGRKIEVYKDFSEKYLNQDELAFAGVDVKTKNLIEGLAWDMKSADLKKIYPFAKEAKDPDFVGSFFVGQEQLKTMIAHANFMSLGMFDDKLYGVKFEFGATEKSTSQAIEVPNNDIIIYARFEGLYKALKLLYGQPTVARDNVEKLPLLKRPELVKSGADNIYVFWAIGNTKLEIVLFGFQDQLKLTLRLLYMPVWSTMGKE